MKAYGGVDVDPRILHDGTSWQWVVSFTPQQLYILGTHRIGGWIDL
jgi:hypothetical protein